MARRPSASVLQWFLYIGPAIRNSLLFRPMCNSTTTLHTDPVRPGSEDDTLPVLLAIVLAWSVDEPHRVGEVLFVPAGNPGPKRVMGRATNTGPGFIRQRPGQIDAMGPIRSKRISRAQLNLQAQSDGSILVENVGRRTLYINGRKATHGSVMGGDVLEVGNQLVLLCCERPVRMRRIAEGVALPFHEFGGPDTFGAVGESPAMWDLRARVAFVAGRETHVMVYGETGTGKELVAQAIHSMSSRGQRQMISRNAATLPESLIDAELFGNVRGYPNPGMRERPGLIGEADGSTLFLDEVGELSADLQSHLLRVLDAGEYQRLGDATMRASDFRLVVATNRAPELLKHDLFARLRVRINTPDLNSRIEDVPLLIKHLLRSIAVNDPTIAKRFFPEGNVAAEPRVSPALVRKLLLHEYTTHVRELEALLWQAMANSSGDVLCSSADMDIRPRSFIDETVDPLDITVEMLQAAMDEHKGVQARVWKALRLRNRHQLARLLKKHGLASPRGDDDETTGELSSGN